MLDDVLIYCNNLNGVKSIDKSVDFLSEVLAAIFKIYMLSETHLNADVSSSEIFPPNFEVFRCDRSPATEQFQRIKRKGWGGVLIAIDKTFNPQCIGTAEHLGAEQVWAKVKCNGRNLILAQVYIRPDSPLEVYKAHMNALREVASKAKQNDILLVSGDFNLRNLIWYTCNANDAHDPDIKFEPNPEIAVAVNAVSEKEKIIIDTCHELGLFQICTHHNENKRMLDLLWTNEPNMFTCNMSKSNIAKNETHHQALEVIIHDTIDSKSDDVITYKDFKHADYTSINNFFDNANWNNVFNGMDLNDAIDQFYAIVNTAIDTNVETRTKKHQIHPKWFDSELINLKNRVNTLHKMKKFDTTDETKKDHAELRREYKKKSRSAFRNYKLEMEQLINDDPQKFFEYVRTCNNTNNDLPNEMEYDGKKCSDPYEIANSFATHFGKAYTQPIDGSEASYDENDPILIDRCTNFPRINVTEELVMEKIHDLPNNLVSGPDGIPNMFIKNCIHTLLKPITHILRESLNSGCVPNTWKRSYVRPVHKSGAKYKIENYRGVALQCIIPKLLDSIIANHLNYHMRNIIDSSQHGFVKGKSTITNLAEFTSHTLIGMQHGIQTDAIYLDLAKAFDSVDVKLLIHKLKIMGLNEQILEWIKSYLSERQQIVRLNGAMSTPIEVTSGTGQGYPIGATLFVLFIIDLPHCIVNSNLQSFADDTRFSMQIKQVDDCLALQADLNRVVKYFKRNRMNLNVKKTNYVSYHRGELKFDFKYTIEGKSIDRVKIIKDLGVVLDEKMNFDAHIEYITARAKSRLAWIKRFGREFDDPWTIKRLFFTFVLPIIEYGSQIWNPYTNEKIARIESVQKQFLLFALRKMKWPHRFILPQYNNRLLFLQMITLEERRKIAQICFIHNVICGQTSSKHIMEKINLRTPRLRTRNTEFLELPTRIYNYSMFEPINYMLITYNEFYKYFNIIEPNQTNDCDTSTIPKIYKTYLIDFNVSTNTVKQRITDYFRRNRTWRD
ncbi:uncharacterized protein LOC129571418 [Sitodiplosis mosellana]|uniref:uncharacterized protein LOC129571418 n=1 Tax=Sitodiplosis mosellana TaxID=263140 RepID=UPI0024446344|nr:uncharacterized protein LOC129571418 [Sitodiplosis mosellana]